MSLYLGGCKIIPDISSIYPLWVWGYIESRNRYYLQLFNIYSRWLRDHPPPRSLSVMSKRINSFEMTSKMINLIDDSRYWESITGGRILTSNLEKVWFRLYLQLGSAWKYLVLINSIIRTTKDDKLSLHIRHLKISCCSPI